MKTVESIGSSPRIKIGNITKDGVSGEISLPLWRGSFVASTGAGWEHVSVAPYTSSITPSWDDMCKVKDIFFEEDEAAIQIHPKKEDYIDNVKNCLHLWRCTMAEQPLPPWCLVGAKPGVSRFELMEEIKKAYKAAGEEF